MTVMLDIDFDFFVREHPHLDWGHGEGGVQHTLAAFFWQIRASTLAANGIDLGELLTPPDDPSPEVFWDELRKRGWKFSSDLVVLVSNTHARVGMEWLERNLPVEEIIHFDAHHDLGYDEASMCKAEDEGWLDCATWLYTTALYSWTMEKIRLVYPEWRRQSGGSPYSPSEFLAEECPEEVLLDREERLEEAGIELTWEHWLDGAHPPEREIGVITICQSSSWVPPWWDARFKAFVEAAPGRVEWLDDPLWGKTGFQLRWSASSWEEARELLAGEIESYRQNNEALLRQVGN